MPLPTYGLLIGKVTASRPQTGGRPHWLIMVAPAIKNHPAYRVAVNLQSTEPGSPPEVQYQVIDVDKDGTPGLQALVAELRKQGQTDSFLVGSAAPAALDFVRGGLCDATQFKIDQGGAPLKAAFEQALTAAIAADSAAGALLAVFGTGYPVNAKTQSSPSTGYTGVDNIHMNQGAPDQVGGPGHFKENGANQDGGLIFFTATTATAFFVKFQSQSTQTDANGNPVKTGIAQLDENTAAALQTLKADPKVTATLTALAAPPPPAGAPAPYTFADPDPETPTAGFVPDVDTYSKQPFVTQQALGQIQDRVPTPRSIDPMLLSDIIGAAATEVIQDSGTIQFDLIGDSGAPKVAKLPGEKSVGELITAKAQQSKPAFLFHVGDVVYYYGEKAFYYGQFADIFKDYPAPIFAIPGNHDALIHDQTQNSLDSFIAAFCQPTPGPWDGFGGIRRSTMTQPGVYFTLDAPLVSIIGLYSNAGESTGFLDQNQYGFLRAQLTRLKPLRAAGERAVILAVHHMPRWFPGRKDPMSVMIDSICNDVGLWPDAVTVGHAHLYQRIVRQQGVVGAPKDIPYFVIGNGGYGIMALEALGGPFVKGLAPGLAKQINEEGFVRATVTKTGGTMSLKFDAYSAKQPDAGAVDTYTVQLA